MVVRRGWHIDVGFAVRDLDGPLRQVSDQFPAPRFLFFGFGDERYIRATSHRLPTLLAAAWPGKGVVLVTAINNLPAEAFGPAHVIALPISPRESSALQAFIWGSFSAASESTVTALKAGPYEDSLYFGGRPAYSGLHTCNTWAAEALQAGGLPVRSRTTLFASQLWRQVHALAPSVAQVEAATP